MRYSQIVPFPGFARQPHREFNRNYSDRNDRPPTDLRTLRRVLCTMLMVPTPTKDSFVSLTRLSIIDCIRKVALFINHISLPVLVLSFIEKAASASRGWRPDDDGGHRERQERLDLHDRKRGPD